MATQTSTILSRYRHSSSAEVGFTVCDPWLLEIGDEQDINPSLCVSRSIPGLKGCALCLLSCQESYFSRASVGSIFGYFSFTLKLYFHRSIVIGTMSARYMKQNMREETRAMVARRI